MSRTYKLTADDIQTALLVNQAERKMLAVQAMRCRQSMRRGSGGKIASPARLADLIEQIATLRLEYEAMSDTLLIVSAGAAA